MAKNHYESIDIKYLIAGHSDNTCGRDFDVIEKRKRCMAMVPEDLEHVMRTARVSNLSIVERMTVY